MRRSLRVWLWRSVGAIGALLLLLPLSAYVALQTELGRELLRQRTLPLLDGVLAGRIYVDRLEHVSPTLVRVRGVRILDRSGRQVLHAARFSARLAPLALLSNHVELTRVWAQDVQVDLGDPNATGGGLPSVFDTEPGSEPAATAPWRVTLEQVDISDAEARLQLDHHVYVAHRLHVRARVHATAATTVEIKRAFGMLRRDQRDLATLALHDVAYRGRGEAHQARGALHAWSGPSELRVNASLGPADAHGAQPLSVQCQARRLGPDLFASLELPIGTWNAPVDVNVRATGSTRAVSYLVDVIAPRGRLYARGTWSAPATFDALLQATDLVPRTIADVDVDAVTATVRAHVAADARLSRGELSVAVSGARYAGERMPWAHVVGGWTPDRTLVLREIHARHAAPDATLAGSLRVNLDHFERLTLDLHATARNLVVGTQRVRRVALDVSGGPQRYRACLDVAERGRIELTGLRREERLHVSGSGAVQLTEDATVRFLLRHSVFQSDRNAVQVGELRIAHAGAVARVHGNYDPARRSRLFVDVDVPDVRRALGAWIEMPIVGSAKLHGELAGSMRAPQVSGHLHYRGTQLMTLRDVSIDAAVTARLGRTPTVTGDLRAKLRVEGDERPVTAAISGDYRDSHVDLSLTAHDRDGALMRARIDTDVKQWTVPSDREGIAAFLAERSWNTELSLAARRIADLPGVRALGVPEALLPARVSADVRLAHAPRQEPEGELVLRAVFREPESEAVATCGYGSHPVVDVVARMQRGELAVKATVHARMREKVRVSVASIAPLTEWFVPVTPRPITLEAQLASLDLAQLPLVCERMAGTVTGSIRIERALFQDVRVAVALEGKQLRADIQTAQAAPFDATIVGKANREHVAVQARLRSKQGRAVIRAKLPIDGATRVPMLDVDAPLTIDAALDGIDVPALLTFVPEVRARSGTLDGQVRVTGSLADPDVRGDLRIVNATVLLPELGQPFERINGRLVLDGKALRLTRTRIHDREGWADLEGRLVLIGPRTVHIDAVLSARDLPIRRGGVILARFNGQARLDVDLGATLNDVDLSLHNASIELAPNGELGAVQALAEHEEIRFVDGAPGLLPATTVEATTPLHVSIDARDPFWVRRDDFALLVTTRLAIEMDAGDPVVTGKVEIQRGFIELIGKLFDVEHGRIEFAGGHAVEPAIDILASHRAPGGSLVTVEANGTVRAPDLRFSVDGAPVTAGEALAAAAGSRSSNASAATVEQQVGAVASGLLSGVLTLGARRGFGEWVPILAIESTDRESRLRAGIDAHQLIPKLLRPIVLDAYVEGILSASKDPTATGAQDSAPQTDAAVLLELRFPYHLVGEAQYGPGARWSTDLSWEP